MPNSVLHCCLAKLVTAMASGKYLPWSGVLTYFGNDVEKATNLVRRRRSEPKGCSTDRNDGAETFLVFKEEERAWKSTSLAPGTDPVQHR